MANIKISDLTAAAAVTGAQEFEVNDSLTSKKITGTQILSYVQNNLVVSQLQTANWTVVESGNQLLFKYGGVTKFTMDSTTGFTAA